MMTLDGSKIMTMSYFGEFDDDNDDGQSLMAMMTISFLSHYNEDNIFIYVGDDDDGNDDDKNDDIFPSPLYNEAGWRVC